MTELAVDLELARTGDDSAFTRLVEPLRRELHAHCYRMLGSVHDADDALQEALLRAWRGLPGFEGRASLRSWLYTVATRTCLDAVEQRGRRALPMDLGPSSDHVVTGDAPRTDVAWLGPYPTGPDTRAEQREAVELAFVAALQHLPGNQRAALVLFEVLGFSAAEIASMMNTSAASVNSALQRARRIMPAREPVPDDARVRALASDYAGALERGDADALVALLTEDVTWSMPPMPHWYHGIDAVMSFARRYPLASCGSWRHRIVSANGLPAVASYLSREAAFESWSINVLTPRDGRIAEVTSFVAREHFAAFGLPDEVD
ncbi:sigma-70 family RNA polymerase sigma factor [Amycolatopsis ruanii]|uniref:sigma-70 family RNA polymerase sigma factor n=1 Tax=Amycolatopsis ruanii TaxID=944491 RepID=UPI000E2825D5|nr:sigma-70 family RNA polymerase sigma factor [Amycolatopsis ruanii]